MNEIIFDKENHKYYLDSRNIPSVTTVLKSIELYDFSYVDDKTLKEKMQIGTEVHSLCEEADKFEIVIPKDLVLLNYLDSWRKFKKDSQFLITEIEEMVFSKKYWYAGRFDRVGYLYEKKCVLDIKTSYDFGIATGLQLSAYQQAYNEMNSDKVIKRYAVLLQNYGNYKLHEYNNNTDFQVFLSALNIYNWKENNHGK